MNLEGRKVIVNKSSEQLFQMLKNPEDYKHLMPDSLTSFEHREDGFKFGLKGMPEVALKIAELVEGKKVVLSFSKKYIKSGLTEKICSILLFIFSILFFLKIYNL